MAQYLADLKKNIFTTRSAFAFFFNQSTDNKTEKWENNLFLKVAELKVKNYKSC